VGLHPEIPYAEQPFEVVIVDLIPPAGPELLKGLFGFQVQIRTHQVDRASVPLVPPGYSYTDSLGNIF